MTERRPLFLLIALLFGWGCASSAPPEIGSETNWLRQCSANADCDSAGSCVCGICSQRCITGKGECGSGLTCQPSDSALVQDACGSASTSGLCAPECERNADCASDHCVSGACTAAPAKARSGVPNGRIPDAFVVAALSPDSSCTYASDNPIIAIGLLDISQGGLAVSQRCAHGYRMKLKISSNEPGVLQLSGARIELMTIDHETLLFDADAGTLPNPFTFESSQTVSPATGGKPTTAIFEVEAVRADQAPLLSDFVAKQILAEITVLGTDADDKPIAFRPFLYPMDICDACLTQCASVLTPEVTRQDFAQDRCDDNSGTDGRICFDPDC